MGYYSNGRYSKYTIDKQPLGYVLKWSLKNIIADSTDKKSVLKPDEVKLGKNKEDFILWLGHASFYMQINGVKIITDPVLFSIPLVPRLTELPVSLDFLKPDIVLISHAHRDHLDLKSIEVLKSNNDDLKIITPLGVSKCIKNINCLELDWDENYNFRGVEFISTPSSHWHARGIFDFNNALWCSYLIKSRRKSIFFAGDTAYGEHFKSIRDTIGGVDVALMPIGAYSPREVMKNSHLNPDEALLASKDLNALVMIPYHYSTFNLSDEDINEPLKWIKSIGESEEIVEILEIGKIRNFRKIKGENSEVS